MKISDVTKIRYIKLGEGGKWAKDCFEQKIIRLGYSSGADEVFDLASNKHWSGVEKYWQSHGKSIGVSKTFTNQIKDFFNDDGSTLWITFEDGYLYYCFSDGLAKYQDSQFPSNSTTSFKKAKNGWSNLDVNGNALLVTHLSGMITKTQAYDESIEKELADINAQNKDLLADTDYPAPDAEQKALKKDYSAEPHDHAVLKNSYRSDFTVAGGKTPPAKTTNDLPMGNNSPMTKTKRPPRPATGANPRG